VTLASTWASIGWPANSCSTFGRLDRIRVPWPAARTTTASFLSVISLPGHPATAAKWRILSSDRTDLGTVETGMKTSKFERLVT
jgi:hypothetical protein